MIQLRPSEIRFWQEAYLAAIRCPVRWQGPMTEVADNAVEALRERLPQPDPNVRDR